MSLQTTPGLIESKVLKTEPAKWKDFTFIQQEDFKELPPDAHAKLKASIVANNFTQPFYVWHDPETGHIFCLDGKHRTKILEELISESYDIPETLPATFIDCKDKTEAAKLVLIYSSIYASITDKGLSDFVSLYNLDLEELRSSVNIPGLELPDLSGAAANSFDDDGIGVKNQFGVIVMCEDEKDQEKIFTALSESGYNCKVVVT